MNPADNHPGFEETDFVTPEDIEALAMSNTNACDLPPDASDDAEEAGAAWD